MNFPQFWAQGKSGDFIVWRWSNQSLAEAQSLANQAVQQLADRFRGGGFPPHQGHYYPDRPFREQILQEFKKPDGTLAAVVTRNSYGCQVLNAARVMFVDIDLPEPKPAPGFLGRLFGKTAPPPPTVTQDSALARIESWTRNQSGWGWRIYRTRAGLRLLATQALVEADSTLADDVLRSLEADPLYHKLCKTQKCFRARLTPKPWRCGLAAKPERWPWLDAHAEHKFQKWEKQYQTDSDDFATCELIKTIGNSMVHPDIAPIIKLHDEATRTGSKLPLA